MRFTKILLLTISLMGLFAFAQDLSNTTSPSVDTKSSKATVYIYRYKQFVGSALEPSVYCDDVQLARMTNGRYFTVTIDPGKHTFHSNDKQSGIELDAKAGQEYFIRLEIAAGMMKGHGRLILMSPEQAGYELKSDKLKPLDPSKVVDTTLVSTAEAHPGLTDAAKASAAPKVVNASDPDHKTENPQ